MLFEPPKGVQLRHELKHLISLSDKYQLIARLGAICSPDPHYGAESYHIRSLYFDNVYDKALVERLNGLEYREKFRIRFYNFDDSYIVLEKKIKHNQLCGKQSARVTRSEVESLLCGDIQWLLQKDSPLCHELYAKMRAQLLKPKVIVDYSRRAFVYAPGNTRITLDDNIRTGLSSLDLFNPNLVTVPADITRSIVLEVKYDQYIPDIIRRAVRLENRRTANFSKYAASRLTDF